MSLSINSQANPYGNVSKFDVTNNTSQIGNAVINSQLPGNTKATKANDTSPETQALKHSGIIECQTCKNRTYQDGSDDPGVSFKTPGHISPESSASVVMGHEQEHVKDETAKASAQGRKIVSQTVSLQTSVCPECGKVYVSGGLTKTVTKANNKKDYFMDNMQKSINSYFGKALDIKV